MIDRFGLFLLEFGRLFKKDVSGEAGAFILNKRTLKDRAY